MNVGKNQHLMSRHLNILIIDNDDHAQYVDLSLRNETRIKALKMALKFFLFKERDEGKRV